MKQRGILCLILSILEGGLAGGFFYLAERTEERKRGILFFLLSAGWFLLSVLDGVEGSRILREALAEGAGEEELPA